MIFPERAVLIIRLVTSLQKPYYGLNIKFSPPTPNPPPKHHIPKPDITARISNIVNIFIMFCGIRRYFVQILILSGRGGAKALNRLSV